MRPLGEYLKDLLGLEVHTFNAGRARSMAVAPHYEAIGDSWIVEVVIGVDQSGDLAANQVLGKYLVAGTVMGRPDNRVLVDVGGVEAWARSHGKRLFG